MGPKAQVIVALVTRSPGTTIFQALRHLLTETDREAPNTKAFRRAASVVARVIRDRLVRQVGERLYPWNRELFDSATALERAAFAEGKKNAAVLHAAQAWHAAGDANRAQMLRRFFVVDNEPT